MKNNVVKIPIDTHYVEQLSDIEWCESVFETYKYNMEDNFMNPDVVHAYQLLNIIRISLKKKKVYDEALYTKTLKALAYYGDLLYGKDIRIKHWRVQRLIEQGYDIKDVAEKW